MKAIHRWIVLAVLILSALGCYAIGSMAGFGLFIVLGLIFELVFWRGLFKQIKNDNRPST